MLDDQKEIGSILIEMNNRNVDKFVSLIELTVVVFALYTSVVIYKPEILESLQTTDWSLLLCILSILLAMEYSISQIQEGADISTLFKKNGELIQYKNEQELSEQNRYLFSSINIQNDTFISSIILIVCSLGFSFNYLLPEKYYLIQHILFWVLFALFVISVAFKHRENLKPLYRRLEYEIIGYNSFL